MKWLKWVGALLLVMLTAAGAYSAATQATRRKGLAVKERQLERRAGEQVDVAIAAGTRAKVHEKAARAAAKVASARIEAIALQDPELESVVNALNTRTGRKRKRR